MRLYSGQYNLIATDIVRDLQKKGLIDVGAEEIREAELDVVGVLREYNRMDRELTRMSRDQAPGESRGAAMKVKRRLAREKNFRLGDDALEYVVNQIIETFIQSAHIEEIYGEDTELRAQITPIIKRYTRDRDEDLDTMVRSKIRNLEEGSAAWDIEYERTMNRVRRTSGLDKDDE